MTGVISSMDSLVNGARSGAVVLVERDAISGFARVTVNGRLILEGPTGDFVPSKMGGWHEELALRHGPFASPETLADRLESALAGPLGRIDEYVDRRGAHYMAGR
jgi:hypothetical protein